MQNVRSEMLTHTDNPANDIADGPITDQLSVLQHFVKSSLTCFCEAGENNNNKTTTTFNEFEFRHFIGRFPSGGEASK